MSRTRSFLFRFVQKFFHDAVPIAMAGAIATFTVSQFNRAAQTPSPVNTSGSASEAMMQMLRDDHAVVADFLKHELDKTRRINGEDDQALKAAQLATIGAKKAQAKVAVADKPFREPPSERAAIKSTGAPLTVVSADTIARPMGSVTAAPSGATFVPAPPSALPPVATLPPAPPPASGLVDRVSGWARTTVELPRRVWIVTTDLFDDTKPPVPPMPVPSAEFQARM